MTVHISQTISNDQVKVRWTEPYTSGALNKKFYASLPKGVYAGFTVVPGAALGLWIDIIRDPVLNASVAVVNENTGGKYAPTIISENDFAVDLATVPGLPATVYVCLDVQYSIGALTAAQIRIVDAAEIASNTDLIVLARVLVPASGPIPSSNINSAYRQAAGDFIQSLAKPRQNLVYNPGFEMDADTGPASGWTSSGGGLTLTTSADFPRTGTKSMKLSAGGAVTLQADSTFMPAVAGQEFRVEAWMRSTGGSPITGGTGAQLQVAFYDKSFSIIGSASAIDTAFTGGGTTYVVKKGHVTAPALAAHAKVSVAYGNCAGVLYVDDIEYSSRAQDALTHNPVFGGPLSNADSQHGHSAASAAYAGGGTWKDGTTNPATTVEAQLDKIVSDLGSGTGGAAKISSAATGDVAATDVQAAIAELAAEKANLNSANHWGAQQFFDTFRTESLSGFGAGSSGYQYISVQTALKIGVQAADFLIDANLTMNMSTRTANITNANGSAGHFMARVEIPSGAVITAVTIYFGNTGISRNGTGYFTRSALNTGMTEIALENGGAGQTLTFGVGSAQSVNIPLQGGSYTGFTSGVVHTVSVATPSGFSAGELTIYGLSITFDYQFVTGFMV